MVAILVFVTVAAGMILGGAFDQKLCDEHAQKK